VPHNTDVPAQLAVAAAPGTVTLWSLVGDAWETAGGALEGLWPASRPGTNAWTSSTIGSAAALVHQDGGETLEVPGSRTEPPLLLAARLAHYALWSPGGDALCYVVPDGRALSLRTWRPPEVSARIHLSAAPVFSSWVPGSNWLLCHHGTSLSAFETVSGEQRVISTAAAGFRAPAVSEDGALVAWAEVRETAVAVFRSPLEPANGASPAATFPGGVTLAFRPGTDELTLAVARDPASGVFSEVLRLESTSEPCRVVAGPLVAYWWAPDGRRLATLHPAYSGDGRFQVRFHDVRGHFLGATEPFIPSADSATVAGFFDQYAQSHPSWSADGRWFGMCGRLLSEGPHPSFHGRPVDRAMVWDTANGFALQQLGDGEFLSFGRGEVNEG
jgi:hypothetical protein